MKEYLRKGFQNPDVLYRSAPFWSWNGCLEVQELCFQLEKMKEGGFGGGFMHSRIGLVTPYLSRQWLTCIKETVKYARRIGLKAYLYDEDRWPSGFAGGIVTRKKKNRMLYLKLFRKSGQWKWLVENGRPNEWYNGSTYVDTMNRETVTDFLDSTYQMYRKSLGSLFGKTAPAIFTDEPNYFNRWGSAREENASYFPWTKGLEKIFRDKYGYDFFRRFHLLVEKRPGYETLRYHYYRLATELFVENFGKTIFDWCAKNHIALTGHYLGEDTLDSQVSALGSAMPFYQYMQWPGVDHLCRNIGSPLTLKQCSSVAHQLGQSRVLSELYGCSGQNFTFYERKWIADWHIALGVNFFCPHLYLYSLRGQRKRDYPPTFSHHQPYWKYNKPIEDYFARVNFIMSQGRYLADILVIHPVESAWCVKGSPEIKKLDKSLAGLTQSLLEHQLEYDFGDESLLEKYGKTAGGKIFLREMGYAFVVIPPALTLRRKTIQLLSAFLRQGGKVFAAREFPYLVEGAPALGETAALKQHCTIYRSLPELLSMLEKSGPSPLEISDKAGGKIPEMLLHRRQIDSRTCAVFLANSSLNKRFSTELVLKNAGRIWRADPFTGRMDTLPVQKKGRSLLVHLDFEPVESHLLLVEAGGKPIIGRKADVQPQEQKRLTGWRISLPEPNVLVLDYCRYRTARMKKWSRCQPVLEIQKILEKANKLTDVSLLFEFQVTKGFVSRNLNLVVEQAERYKISLNGQALPPAGTATWLDPDFRMVKVPANLVRCGRNELVLTIAFVPPRKKNTLIFVPGGVELETIYLLGDFRLRTSSSSFRKGGYFQQGFSLTNPAFLTEKDLNLQGYPFYAGSIRAETDLQVSGKKRCFLRFAEFKCSAAEVNVNSRPAGLIYLPPFQLEITGFLKPGANRISLTLANSLRNLLGPHHQKDPNPEGVGADSFLDRKGWTDSYTTLPFGLGKVMVVTGVNSA